MFCGDDANKVDGGVEEEEEEEELALRRRSVFLRNTAASTSSARRRGTRTLRAESVITRRCVDDRLWTAMMAQSASRFMLSAMASTSSGSIEAETPNPRKNTRALSGTPSLTPRTEHTPRPNVREFAARKWSALRSQFNSDWGSARCAATLTLRKPYSPCVISGRYSCDGGARENPALVSAFESHCIGVLTPLLSASSMLSPMPISSP